jgi:signal transduction histidine kinase
LYDSALFYLNSSLEISLEINSLSLMEHNYQGLFSIYDTLGHSQKSLEYLKLYLAVHDTLFDSQSDKRIKDLQIKYETEKKEQENILLTNQIEIDKLQSERRRNLMYFFIAISIFLLTLAVVIFNRFTVKHKLSNLLTEKNTKLLESETNLKEAIDTKDKFFSIIAHDLKSPLSSLTLVSEMLNENLEDFTPEKMNYYINSISQTSSGLFDLVENLLSWARSQSGKITINIQKINIYEITSKLVGLLNVNADKKNILIENLIEKDTFVSADINLLTLILRNLLVNAIKFTNEGGKVTLSLIENKENVVISVKDTGIGMNKEDQEKLFRIDIDTKNIGNSAEKGTGLGLILCKEFIEKQNGKIWLESELGKGTTFSISLQLDLTCQRP